MTDDIERALWRTRLAQASLLIGALAAPGARAQEPVRFRASADLVVVHAVPFSRDGAPVGPMVKEDFTLFEDGEERPISVFLAPDLGPVEVAVLVDTSSSMRRWPTLAALEFLLDRLHQESCVLLLPFKETVQVGIWGRPADPDLRQRVRDLELAGDEAVYDALIAAFGTMRSRSQANLATAGTEQDHFDELMRFRSPAGWAWPTPVEAQGECRVRARGSDALGGTRRTPRAVALLSDGDDTSSRASIEEAMLAAWGGGVPLFAFAPSLPRRSGGIGSVGRPAAKRHVHALQRIAAYSGGFVFEGEVDRLSPFDPSSGQGFLQGVDRVAWAVRSHYVLGYIPARDETGAVAETREIEVRARDPSIEVMAPEDIALGRGASTGAALDLVRQGFALLAAADLEGARDRFDSAVGVAPEMGIAIYGRGLTASRLGSPELAAADFETAADLAPWIPDVEARAAEALLRARRTDSAWDYALRAYRRGSEVDELIAELQVTAPRDLVLEALPDVPRVAVEAGRSSSILGAVAIPPLWAGLARALIESDAMALAETPSTADLVLSTDIQDADQHGPRVSVRGWFVLRRTDGDQLDEIRFQLYDSEDAGMIEALVASTLQRVTERIARERR